MFAMTASAELPQNYVKISCLTQNDMSLDSLSLSLITFENNSAIVVGTSIFQAVGNNPALTIEIDSSGSPPFPMNGTVLSNVAFYYGANGINRNYFVGSYQEGFSVEAPQVGNSASYNINLASSIENAKNDIGYNGNIENVGIRGTFTFETEIRNSIGMTGQTQFLNVILDGNGNLSAVTFDFTIPQKAQLEEATNGDQNMEKAGVPYEVGSNIVLNPTQPLGANMYFEWLLPEEPFWLLSPPFSWILSALVGAIFVSIPVKYITDRTARPKLLIKVPKKGLNEPAIHPNSGIAFYHLIVENNGKSSATDSELTLRFRNHTGLELFNLRGKWDSGPEPIGPIINGQPTPMPSLIPFAERINIRRKMPEAFCIVIKDNQAECYAFNCDSYFHGFKNGSWQLPIGNFIVEVEVRSGNAEKKQQFLLKNKGNTIQDIEIQNL
jgi:hypothetical protein